MAVLAPALARLRSEVNKKWPRRDRSSDGWIGDTSHSRSGMPENGGSDHNPNRRGVVDALDIDVDGINPAWLVSLLVKHPAVNYVIWNRTIWSRRYGFRGRKYTGSNPHTKHVHVSLIQSASAENSNTSWKVVTGVVFKPVAHPVTVREDTWAGRLHKALPVLRAGGTARGSVRKLQGLLNAGGARLAVDGVFGSSTAAAVQAFQRRAGTTVDGVVGPATWGKLAGSMPTTRRGADGIDVRRVQALLKLFGAGIPLDGDFGPRTQDAVKAFQRRYELAADGVVGPVTWTALLTR